MLLLTSIVTYLNIMDYSHRCWMMMVMLIQLLFSFGEEGGCPQHLLVCGFGYRVLFRNLCELYPRQKTTLALHIALCCQTVVQSSVSLLPVLLLLVLRLFVYLRKSIKRPQEDPFTVSKSTDRSIDQ